MSFLALASGVCDSSFFPLLYLPPYPLDSFLVLFMRKWQKCLRTENVSGWEVYSLNFQFYFVLYIFLL